MSRLSQNIGDIGQLANNLESKLSLNDLNLPSAPKLVSHIKELQKTPSDITLINLGTGSEINFPVSNGTSFSNDKISVNVNDKILKFSIHEPGEYLVGYKHDKGDSVSGLKSIERSVGRFSVKNSEALA
jgi:hypothetical protein